MFCSFCGGVLCLLGRLGCLVHFRCRDCGMDHSCHADECEDCYED